MNIADIFITASDVRGKFEKGTADLNPIVKEYSDYSGIALEDMPDFLSQADELFPRFNCGIASLYLKKTIGDGEVINGRYSGKGHTFLRIGDTIIADITSDQFGGPRIYVGPLESPWSLK